ncbi:MAG: protein-L-isoaspartate(D-aspartate) O-methyltransferase [Arenicellales bacterium]
MKNGIHMMIADIESEVRHTRSMIGKSALDPRVMNVMASVPRDEFVPDDMKHAAFLNGPLPIGDGQTISQPYIVALMTDMLAIEPEHRVLEIGTGSGYQTAILSQLCKQVYTVECIAALSERACVHFRKLKYENIEATIGNGYEGWPEHAPYDGIIVTAAASHIPEALIEQLKPAGRLVIPVGGAYTNQSLMLVRKDAQGEIDIDSVLGVVFVPLVDEN